MSTPHGEAHPKCCLSSILFSFPRTPHRTQKAFTGTTEATDCRELELKWELSDDVSLTIESISTKWKLSQWESPWFFSFRERWAWDWRLRSGPATVSTETIISATLKMGKLYLGNWKRYALWKSLWPSSTYGAIQLEKCSWICRCV